MPLKRRPVAPLRFQSEKAIQRPKTQREDHHRHGEEHGRQHEERALAALAAGQHLGDAERDRPEQVGIEDRAPGGEAGDAGAGVVQRLER